ncbi:MAG: hypothetical protein EA356_12915 [Geminicoccaceae bacterium]|nr:MAG: hypothetical protein EA356_12915 [Geminicoccaceae bacterium]
MSPAFRSLAVFGLALAASATASWSGAPAEMAMAAGLLVFTIGFWALALLPEALTGLIFFVAAIVSGMAPPATVFAGFTTGAFWLVFAGLLLGAAVGETGLSRWLLERMLPVRRLAEGEVAYGTLIAAVVTFSGGLGLLLPATSGRVVLLVPLILALADRLNYAADSRGRTGMVVAGVVATFVIPITILPANLPNLVLAGSLEALYGVKLTYGAYLALHFPVIGLTKAIALTLIVTRLFGERPGGRAELAAVAAPPLSPGGRRLGLLLVVTLALWATDVVHGIGAAWVGLTAAILCLLPRSGILAFKSLSSGPFMPLLLYVGAVLGLAAVMTESGLGAALGAWLIERLPLAEAGPFAILTGLAALGAGSGLLATLPAAPAIAAPLFPEIARLTGWSIEAIGMAQVLGYATPLFPYQVPPFIVAMAMTGIGAAAFTRTLWWLALTTTPVMLGLAYPWWSLLGWL